MTIRRLSILVRIAYPVGMIAGFAAFWPFCYVVFAVLKLPRPNDESVIGVVWAVLFFGWFFYSVYGCGRLAVYLLQRRVRAKCPQCDADAVGMAFTCWRDGKYRCRVCPYTHPNWCEEEAAKKAPGENLRFPGFHSTDISRRSHPS